MQRPKILECYQANNKKLSINKVLNIYLEILIFIILNIYNMNDHFKKQENYLKSFIIGGISGCAGKTIIAPMERVKFIFTVN